MMSDEPRIMSPACSNCRYSVSTGGQTDKAKCPELVCRRYPPHWVPFQLGDFTWEGYFEQPRVTPNDWCGEHRPDEEDPQ